MMAEGNPFTDADDNRVDSDAPDCGHCHSSRTFYRVDGDLECLDCNGITHHHDWTDDGTFEHPPDGKLFDVNYRCAQSTCEAVKTRRYRFVEEIQP